MRSQNGQPTFCSASRHIAAVFFSGVSNGFYLSIKMENGRRQQVGLECVVAAIQFAHRLFLVAPNLAVKVRLLWRHVRDQECFTVLDFQHILIGAGHPLAAIITTPYNRLSARRETGGGCECPPRNSPFYPTPMQTSRWGW